MNEGIRYYTAEEIRNIILDDIRLSALQQGLPINVDVGSDSYRFATAYAVPFALMQANSIALTDAGDPRTATGPDLENIRLALGLPEVNASSSSGRVIVTTSGVASMASGTLLVNDLGAQYSVVGNYMSLANGSEIDVVSVDTGEETNMGPGESLTFMNAPVNVSAKANVSSAFPLTGGQDQETDARKRNRILTKLSSQEGMGNWGQKVIVALNALSSLQDAFVYPALGGPASELVVVTTGFNPRVFDFSRQADVTQVGVARNALQSSFSSADEIVVKSVRDEPCDVTIRVEIPKTISTGGVGGGWKDDRPWPQLQSGETRVEILNVVFRDEVIVSSNDVLPVAGTRVLWYSRHTQEFHEAIVAAASSVTPGQVTLVFTTILLDALGNPPDVGDFISPSCVRFKEYASTWLSQMESLAPGEMTTDPGRLPRSVRHPYEAVKNSQLKVYMLSAWSESFPEVKDFAYSYVPKRAPSVPASVSLTANVLVPSCFGIYPTEP